MTDNDIKKILENVKINNSIIESLPEVASLLNAFEHLYSKYIKIKNENQKLKEQLTGESVFSPKASDSKNKDISSEVERKKAESNDDEEKSKEGFKLDKKTLELLKEKKIPVKILEKLTQLKNIKYEEKETFVNSVKDLIGEESSEQYIPILIKHARYKKRNRKPKIPEITIDREEKCTLNKDNLPADAIFKGYESKVVQDIIIKRDNVKFNREKYYSESLNETYIAKVPENYEGEFGPNLNASIVWMKYVNNMSIPKILEFFRNFEIIISESYISNRLSKYENIEIFHEEKNEIYRAILEVSDYVQIDDTGCTVNGVKQYTQIICNFYGTVFFTTERKDRLSVLDVLMNFEERKYIFNEEAFILLEHFKVSTKLINLLHNNEKDIILNQEQIDIIIKNIYPNDKQVGKNTRIRILEATAIAYYHYQTEWPHVEVLVADDASQFKLLACSGLMLCWIHEGRHYKRLTPIIGIHQEKVDGFLKQYWGYYKKLFNYKNNPNEDDKKQLSAEFDELFSIKTNYDELDDRISKSKAKKNELLTVLDHPEIPLHNNASENGARVEKRWEDVSLQTKTVDGTKAKDTMNTITETAKKLGVKAINYIHDRVNKINKITPLAELIRSKASKSKVKQFDSS